MDTLSISKRRVRKLNLYRKVHLRKAKISTKRIEYLVKTINYLKEYGDVYIVRLPVHPELMQIENELMPNFDRLIDEAITQSNDYLDLTNQNEKYTYIDGNHLFKDSGKEVSELIANWIKNSK